MTSIKKKEGAFTLIELLIVIAILAVLAVAVTLVLNPVEFIKQARDSRRLSELATINRALGYYQADGNTDLGTANKVYISIPDTSATCANLDLPTLPDGWTYGCSSETNYQNVDGDGWIPIDFTSTSFGAPFQRLPTDPINTVSSGNYYTYVTGGSWELTSFLESERYKLGGGGDISSTDGGSLVDLYEVGTDLTIHPLSRDPDLVGYWKFDETSGSTAYDSSGNDNDGTLTNGPTFVSGKVNNAVEFDGVNDYVDCGDVSSMNSASELTITGWLNQDTIGAIGFMFSKGDTTTDITWIYTYSGGSLYTDLRNNGTAYGRMVYSSLVSAGEWFHYAMVYDGSKTGDSNKLKVYVNGTDISQFYYTNPIPTQLADLAGKPFTIGTTLQAGNAGYKWHGSIDDVRVYSRALSASEISAIYSAAE